MRSGTGAARGILPFHTISARPSKQPRMVGSTLGVYSFGLIFVSARTNKRHHHHWRRPGAARTILLSHIISARPSKQPLMVRTFLKVYMELGFYFLFLQEQIKDIIIIYATDLDIDSGLILKLQFGSRKSDFALQALAE